jgi:hypothetical protein
MRKRYEAVKVPVTHETDPATGLVVREVAPPADAAWYCCSRVNGEVFYGRDASEAEKKAKRNDRQIADSRLML